MIPIFIVKVSRIIQGKVSQTRNVITQEGGTIHENKLYILLFYASTVELILCAAKQGSTGPETKSL